MSPAWVERARPLASAGLGAPALLTVMLAMMVLPLPPLVLDLLFAFSISLAMVVLMAAVYARRPLDFAAFPTVLLLATLLRLALNVASTRVVLLDGHEGTHAAGSVIEAFGAFVVGGSYAVGLVVFAVLVVINFVVVTKGASRISEVSARFTLDALPGKQLAVDADLGSGSIDQDDARRRRAEIADEADFYGAMDGAGKFVRGDAVAGVLILLVNLVGGLAIGTLQHDMRLGAAMRNYSLLTIGDGLVAQIPALLLSTAAAMMVTRRSTAHDVGQQILSQLFDRPRALGVTAAVLGVMGLVPGMPNVAFLLLAGVAAGCAWALHARRRPAPPAAEPPAADPGTEPADVTWGDVGDVDALGLEVGYRLIPMVDRDQGGELMARIKGVRKKSSAELGFLVPPVHIRDNLELPPSGYRLSVMGVPVGEAQVRPDRVLAIASGEARGEMAGDPGLDPVFGMEALWIEPAERARAESLGYTVVDAGTVIATHLSQALTEHAHLLLGHEECQQLLDRLAARHPTVVDNLVPGALPLGTVVRVLRNLLRERVAVRDLRTIAESLAEHAPRSQDPEVLTAVVRARLGRFIVQSLYGLREELPVIALDPALDHVLHQTVQGAGAAPVGMEPGLAERLHRALSEAAQARERAGEPAVLLVADALRPLLARVARQGIRGLHVLALGEVPDDRGIRVVANVGESEVPAAMVATA